MAVMGRSVDAAASLVVFFWPVLFAVTYSRATLLSMDFRVSVSEMTEDKKVRAGSTPRRPT